MNLRLLCCALWLVTPLLTTIPVAGATNPVRRR